MFGNPVSCGNRTFPGTVYIHDRELLTDHHLELNTLHLFVHLGNFKKGTGEMDLSAGPVPKAGMGLGLGPVWACAQGRHEAGPGVCMGLGSRCRTEPIFKNNSNINIFPPLIRANCLCVCVFVSQKKQNKTIQLHFYPYNLATQSSPPFLHLQIWTLQSSQGLISQHL